MVRETVPSQWQQHCQQSDKDNSVQSNWEIRWSLFEPEWRPEPEWLESWILSCSSVSPSPVPLPPLLLPLLLFFGFALSLCAWLASSSTSLLASSAFFPSVASVGILFGSPLLATLCSILSSILSFSAPLLLSLSPSILLHSSGYANKQRTFNHFFSRALCLKGSLERRYIGSMASAWNLLISAFQCGENWSDCIAVSTCYQLRRQPRRWCCRQWSHWPCQEWWCFWETGPMTTLAGTLKWNSANQPNWLAILRLTLMQPWAFKQHLDRGGHSLFIFTRYYTLHMQRVTGKAPHRAAYCMHSLSKIKHYCRQVAKWSTDQWLDSTYVCISKTALLPVELSRRQPQL